MNTKNNKYNSFLYLNLKNLSNFINLQKNINVVGTDIFYKNNLLIGKILRYKDFFNFIQIELKENLKDKNLKYQRDTLFLLCPYSNKLIILDYRYQQVAGSVDEKLQTCDFKKKQYKRLMAVLNFEVEYIYILSDWFKKPEYKDVLAYIHSVGCDYYFNYIPLQKLGLPVN